MNASDFPTFWAAVTVTVALVLVGIVIARKRLFPTQKSLRTALLGGIVVLVLFSFMQWASWYK